MKPYSVGRANKDEKKVLLVIKSNGTELTIAQLGKQAFKDKPNKVVAQSHVRNALRRPIKAGLVKQKGRGLYTGTKLIEKWLAGQPAKPVAAKVPAVSRKVVPQKKIKQEGQNAQLPGWERELLRKREEIDQLGERLGPPARKYAAPASAKPEPNPLGIPSPEQIKKECEEMVKEFAEITNQDQSDPFLMRAGLVILVAGHVGKSDTKIAKVTGLSRGYLIPRLKGLLEAIPPANHWSIGPKMTCEKIEEFWELAKRFLGGAKAKMIGEPTASIPSIPPPF